MTWSLNQFREQLIQYHNTTYSAIWCLAVYYDGVQDQMLLSDNDSRSHVYQYNKYLDSKTNGTHYQFP